MIGSTVIISPASYVTLGAKANLGNVSFKTGSSAP